MMTTTAKKFIQPVLQVGWYGGLLVVILAGIVAGYIVMTQGLIVTNLTDLVPWGLWITIDLSSIALSAGAFSLCAIVYLFGLKEYEPVARTATFIGIIGYSMAMLCLLMDIGRPERFWHGFAYWNTHSVLWEVTMCVGLYFSVLFLEVMPIIAQNEWLRNSLPWLARQLGKVHKITPVLAVLGLGFSLLHQSSLGAVYGVLQARPAWYRPGLAVLFIYSAIIGGISLTIFSSMLSSKLSSRAVVNDQLFENLSKAVGFMLLGYLYFRFWDTFSLTYNYQPGRTEALHLMTSGKFLVNFWLGELLFGTLIPIFILINKKLRKDHGFRMIALGLVVMGVILYRWDVTLVGQLLVLTYYPQNISVLYTRYSPSLIEIIAGAGVIAYGLFAFTLGVRLFKVVNHQKALSESHA